MHQQLINIQGNQRKAVIYASWAIRNLKGVGSVLDIGAADGAVAEVLPATVTYSGLDIGADIYPRTGRVKYIESQAAMLDEVRRHAEVDLVTIFDVMEHTTDFTSLFVAGTECCHKYVFVSLPNEMNLDRRLRFLFGQSIPAHGLDLLKARAGHKHQWLITHDSARKVLVEAAGNSGFGLTHEVFVRVLPRTLWKRLLVRAFEVPLKNPLIAHGIGFVFTRLDS